MKAAEHLADDAITVLKDAFNFIADGHTLFSESDLNRTFAHYRIMLTSREATMLWTGPRREW